MTFCAAARCFSDLIDANGNARTSSRYESRLFPFSWCCILLAIIAILVSLFRG